MSWNSQLWQILQIYSGPFLIPHKYSSWIILKAFDFTWWIDNTTIFNLIKSFISIFFSCFHKLFQFFSLQLYLFLIWIRHQDFQVACFLFGSILCNFSFISSRFSQFVCFSFLITFILFLLGFIFKILTNCFYSFHSCCTSSLFGFIIQVFMSC